MAIIRGKTSGVKYLKGGKCPECFEGEVFEREMPGEGFFGKSRSEENDPKKFYVGEVWVDKF